MKYDYSVSILENVKRLFDRTTDTNNKVIKADDDISAMDRQLLESDANMVEAVIDEFYSVIGEEREEYDV